jgi:hypothetical protein
MCYIAVIEWGGIMARYKRYDCMWGITMNGTAHGTLISYSGGVSKVSYLYDDFSVQSSCISLVENGKTVVESTDTSDKFTYIGFCTTDTKTGKTTMMDDFVLSITYPGGDVSKMTIAMDGKYFYPDYGYVTISTPTPISSGYYGDNGVIVATGAGGSRAILTISNGYYSIDVDDNGDGIFTRIVNDEIISSGCN